MSLDPRDLTEAEAVSLDPDLSPAELSRRLRATEDTLARLREAVATAPDAESALRAMVAAFGEDPLWWR